MIDFALKACGMQTFFLSVCFRQPQIPNYAWFTATFLEILHRLADTLFWQKCCAERQRNVDFFLSYHLFIVDCVSSCFNLLINDPGNPGCDSGF